MDNQVQKKFDSAICFIVDRCKYLNPDFRRSNHVYLVAAILMLIALMLRLSIAPVSAGLQYVTFFPAVTVAAMIGGWRAGLFCTWIGIILATYIFTLPYYEFSIEAVKNSLWANIVFLVDGCIVSYSIEYMHRFREKYLHELQEANNSRDQLAALNSDLNKNIFELRVAETQLRIAAATFDSHEAIMITDADANIIRVNRAFENTTGHRADEVIGRNPRLLKSGRHDHEFYKEMWQKLLTEGYWKGEIWDRNKNGDIYPKEMTVTAVKNELGKITQYVAIFSDITKRKESEETIHNLAFYDALTGIPNRRLLLDRLHAAVLASSRTKKTGALLFLDLDRFKMLNDTLGHEVGDLLLIEVAQRLQNCVRAVDTVARFGGDEFVLLLEDMGTNQKDALHNAGHMAEKIHNTIVQPFQLRDHMYECTPSIGVCIFSHAEKDTFDTLLKHADMAMYHAKETGRNKIVFYDPLMQQSLLLRASLESDLRKAISERELSLYYQIQVDQDNFPIGAEALIRWNHSQRGFISPAEFIPLAEESNLIFDIGDWVIDTACRQLTAWSSNPMTRRLTIAINISAKQFKQPDFVDKLVRVLNSNDFDRSHLKIELTESVALDNLSFAIERMLEIKKTLGIKIAMDDFGIGYSSLSYLRQLPFDQIKIDQSFVRNITVNVGDDIMVKSIIDMTKNLGLHVIAEGVETETQLDFLRKHGCYTYQGYFFGKPMPIEEFEKLLKLQQQPKLIQTKHTVNKK